MMKSLLTLITCLFFSTSSLWATEKPDTPKADKVITLVGEAVKFYQEKGREEALKEIMKTKEEGGKFSNAEFYVYVFDLEGNCLARGDGNRKLLKNMLDLTDPNGVAYVKEMLSLIRKQGKGWVQYQNNNPATKTIEPKYSYVEKVGNDLMFGSGFYK